MQYIATGCTDSISSTLNNEGVEVLTCCVITVCANIYSLYTYAYNSDTQYSVETVSQQWGKMNGNNAFDLPLN